MVCSDPHTALAAKVVSAADHYRMKYGVVPDLCLVHPSMINGPPDLSWEALRRSQFVRAVLSCHVLFGLVVRIKTKL
jgi:hypothetical protein